MSLLANGISQLEDMRSRLKRLPSESAEAKDLIETAGKACENIGRVLLDAIKMANFNIKIDQACQIQRGRTARGWAAMAGAISLCLPMLIMLRFPGEIESLVTTYVFVCAVGISLAHLMHESQPKDIFACVAAYAAVLVVFVGTGQ
jgi:phosphatidylserine synthase